MPGPYTRANPFPAKVAVNRSDLDFTHMPHSLGVGLTVHAGGLPLVRLYYGASPPMARAIATDDALRARVRTLLRPLIGVAHMARQ